MDGQDGIAARAKRRRASVQHSNHGSAGLADRAFPAFHQGRDWGTMRRCHIVLPFRSCTPFASPRPVPAATTNNHTSEYPPQCSAATQVPRAIPSSSALPPIHPTQPSTRYSVCLRVLAPRCNAHTTRCFRRIVAGKHLAPGLRADVRLAPRSSLGSPAARLQHADQRPRSRAGSQAVKQSSRCNIEPPNPLATLVQARSAATPAATLELHSSSAGGV